MATNPADEQISRRYKMWQLAKEKSPATNHEKPQPNRAKPQVSKLSDLETLLLIYNYGHPMDLAVETRLTGPSGSSAACKTKKLSSESIECRYNPTASGEPPTMPRRMAIGSVVSLEMDKVGAFKGVLTSQSEEGFEIALPKENQKMLGTRLAHIAAERGDSPDALGTIKHGVTRIEPIRKECAFTDLSATLRTATIVNLSQYDALLRASGENIPPLGSRIVLRGDEWHGADVISVFEMGFIVRFSIPIPAEKFAPTLRFTSSR